MSKEKATERARLFESTYNRISIKAAKRGKTSMAQIIDEQDKIATIASSNIGRCTLSPTDPFMKLMRKAINTKPKSSTK